MINVQIKNVPKLNFLNWNKYLRRVIRVPLFFLPFAYFYNDFENKNMEMALMYRKYWSRLVRYQKTGDMKYMDP